MWTKYLQGRKKSKHIGTQLIVILEDCAKFWLGSMNGERLYLTDHSSENLTVLERLGNPADALAFEGLEGVLDVVDGGSKRETVDTVGQLDDIVYSVSGSDTSSRVKLKRAQ